MPCQEAGRIASACEGLLCLPGEAQQRRWRVSAPGSVRFCAVRLPAWRGCNGRVARGEAGEGREDCMVLGRGSAGCRPGALAKG
eukprot:12805285-Alexandrium_andersonii.AAC.1